MVITSIVLILTLVVSTAFSSFSIFGITPAIPLLVAIWAGYRYGPSYCAGAVIFVGLWASFFSIDPANTIFSYLLTAAIASVAVALTTEPNSYSKLGSIVVVLMASMMLLLGSTLAVFDAFAPVQMLTYFVLYGLMAVAIWSMMLFLADPKP